MVILGSFVPDGIAVGEWIVTNAGGVTAFYDIDTPVTLRRLEGGDAEYVNAALIPRFDLYLSFTGGPTLELIEEIYGSPRACALYCAVDPQRHVPVQTTQRWELGYIGTFSEDRQPLLERLLIEPARHMPDSRFVVAGAQYPETIRWPSNVERIEHLPPGSHSEFYCSQRYTLNLTRSDMAAAGFSPSVRLFEASACGAPVISDRWPGIDTFLMPGREILLAQSASDVLHILREFPDSERSRIAAAARKRVLRDHTAHHRAIELEQLYRKAIAGPLIANTMEASA
jgi:spore maturation protein CgeB